MRYYSNVYICISITHGGRYLEAMEQLQENLEEYDKLQHLTSKFNNRLTISS